MSENDSFVRLVGGVKRADRMQQIWNMSYPQGNCGMLKGKSKEEVFREKAKAEGFTDNFLRSLNASIRGLY